MSKFLSILFDPHEATCFSPDKYGTALDFVTNSRPTDVFFSINPLQGSRRDANVTTFRNILIEIDSMPLDEQLAYVDSRLGRENISTIVYSGGKSYHFIISLDTPCETREEYDALVQRVHALMPDIDSTCKNPSRFSRLANVTRPDTNKLQTLVYSGSRVLPALLTSKLPALTTPKSKHSPTSTGFFHPLVVQAKFNPEHVMQILGIDSRNMFFFWLGNRLAESGIDKATKSQVVEQVYLNLKHTENFSLKEARNAARL